MKKSIVSLAVIAASVMAAVVPANVARAATGDQLAQYSPTPGGNGRGMATDGSHLFYTITSAAAIYETDLSGSPVKTITSPATGGPLAWDAENSTLWTMNYSDPSATLYELRLDGTVVSTCNLSTTNPSDPGIPDAEDYPDGLDYSNGHIWISNEADASPWIVSVDTTCHVQSEFQPSTDSDGMGPSGLAVVGSDLWLAYPYTQQVQQVSMDGKPTGLKFSTGALELEDLAFDSSTFAPKCALWGDEATFSSNRLTAYEVPCTAGPPPPTLNIGDYKVAGSAQEPSIAVDPKSPKHVVIGYNSESSLGIFHYVHCGFATSWDGGKTWTTGTLGSVGGQGSRGDPSVVFAPDGTVFYVCQTERTDQFTRSRVNGIGIYASSDGGKTFKGRALAAVGVESLLNHAKDLEDQETVAAGPDGKLHVCLTDVNTSSTNETVEIVDSRDSSGRTWSSPRPVPNTPGDDTRGCGIAVTSTGRVWVSWWDTTTGEARAAYRDPGTTRFTNVGAIGPKVAAETESDNSRLGWQVHLAADPRPKSNSVLATWADWTGTSGVALIAYTTDTHWYGDCGAQDSLPCYASDSSQDASQPAIAWGSTGAIALGYYVLSNGSLTYRIGEAIGLNQPFGFRKAASAPSSLSADATEPFDRLGDYTSVAIATDGSFYASWSDTRSGNQEVWVAS